MFQRFMRAIGRIFNTFRTGGYELLTRPRTSSTNYPVTSETLLTWAPIWYSTRKISGHVGVMEKKLQRVQRDEQIETVGRGASSMTWQGRLWNLLNLDPNGMINAHDLIEVVQKDAILDGNGRLAIIRRGTEPAQLVRIAPSTCWSFIAYEEPSSSPSQTVADNIDNGTFLGAATKWHHITTADGQRIIWADEDMLHIKGLQSDGITGVPLWDVARDSAGGAKTAEAHSNRMLTNGNMPGVILEVPEGVLRDEDELKEFVKQFNARTTDRQAGSVAILRHGIKASTLSSDNRNSQLLETRQFTRDEAWLWTGDVQFYSGADNVYRNGSEIDNAYLSHTLITWKAKWEAECTLKLLTRRQRDLGWYLLFDMMGILRGTLKAQLEALQIGRTIGTFSEEDTRRALGMSPKRRPGENYENPNTSSESSENVEPGPDEVEPEPENNGENGRDPRSYRGDLARDRWIYEKHGDSAWTARGIARYLLANAAELGFDPIGTDKGVREASHRYAEFMGLPRINRRAAARATSPA